MGREHMIIQADTTAGVETFADAQQHDTAAHPNHLSATIDRILKHNNLRNSTRVDDQSAPLCLQDGFLILGKLLQI